MKKLIFFLIVLAAVPAAAFGKNAAPYTDEALKKINRVITETPLDNQKGATPREAYHKRNVEYFIKVFDKAGYSYSGTIDKIVDDMKNNSKSIPKDRETVYNKIFMLLNIMMYECEADKIDCLKFYPPKTGESIQWFINNSGFSAAHHSKAK